MKIKDFIINAQSVHVSSITRSTTKDNTILQRNSRPTVWSLFQPTTTRQERTIIIFLPAVRLHTYTRVLLLFHTRLYIIVYIHICNLFKSTIGNESAKRLFRSRPRGSLCFDGLEEKHPHKISESSRNSDNNNNNNSSRSNSSSSRYIDGGGQADKEIGQSERRRIVSTDRPARFATGELTIIIYIIIIKRRFRERVFFTAAVAYTYAARIREHTIITIMIIRPVRPARQVIFSSYIRVITVIYCYRRRGGTAFAGPKTSQNVLVLRVSRRSSLT